MKPTNDIIDELRKESAHGPCPRRVSDLLTEAADRLDHLFASGIHTCHADCQRPMCVLRRERDKALAELERVTEERDGCRSDIDRYTWNLAGCDTIASGWGKPGDYNKEMALPALDSVSRMAQDLATLRARVAELDRYRVAIKLAEEMHLGRCASSEPLTAQEYRNHACKARNILRNALARVKPAAPAKHPGAEPEVIGGYEGEGGRRFWWTGGTWLYPGQEVAVISARKQEAAR